MRRAILGVASVSYSNCLPASATQLLLLTALKSAIHAEPPYDCFAAIKTFFISLLLKHVQPTFKTLQYVHTVCSRKPRRTNFFIYLYLRHVISAALVGSS